MSTSAVELTEPTGPITSDNNARVEGRPGPWRRFIRECIRARTRKHLSQAQVAEIIKVEADVIKRMENGRAEPGIVLVADLTRVLEINIMNAVYGQRSAKLVEEAQVQEAVEAKQAVDAL